MYALTVRDTQLNTIDSAFKYPDVQWPPRFFLRDLTRLPGYLFDFIAHPFSSSTFSSSATSLLCKCAELALLQDFYMTFLSVKVLPPPSNQWAFSSLNPLIKRHLRRSLPWAPHIKSRPHPLPRCPAPPILLLLCFIFHHHPYCPKGCALIYHLSLQAQNKLCKNRDFACNVYCSVSLILQHKLAWTHCRYSVNVCLMDEKALTVLKQEIPFHITVCVSMGCVCIHTQYDLTQPAVLYINERCCISDQWKE